MLYNVHMKNCRSLSVLLNSGFEYPDNEHYQQYNYQYKHWHHGKYTRETRAFRHVIDNKARHCENK